MLGSFFSLNIYFYSLFANSQYIVGIKIRHSAPGASFRLLATAEGVYHAPFPGTWIYDIRRLQTLGDIHHTMMIMTDVKYLHKDEKYLGALNEGNGAKFRTCSFVVEGGMVYVKVEQVISVRTDNAWEWDRTPIKLPVDLAIASMDDTTWIGIRFYCHRMNHNSKGYTLRLGKRW